MRVRIRDSRDVRGKLCGNVQIDHTTFAYAEPRTIFALRDPTAITRLELRLKGHDHVRVHL